MSGATCGYCNRELVKRGDRFECARCAPLLAEVKTVEEWTAFQRWAWKTRRRVLAVRGSEGEQP